MELYSTLSCDLSDDAKFSYERTIRSIDVSNLKFLKKNSIERVNSYKQFYKGYYRGEYLVHEQYREWPKNLKKTKIWMLFCT